MKTSFISTIGSEDYNRESYLDKINSISLELDLSKKTYPYIPSDLKNISGIIESLYKENIIDIKHDLKICDIGFGLGLSLFEIKNQFDKIKLNENKYYGIENDHNIINIFNSEFKVYWNKSISIIDSDAYLKSYNEYDLIYTYLIYKEKDDLLNLYNKIFNEMKVGSIFYEYRNWGLSDKKYLLKVKRDDIIMKPIYFGNHLNYIFIKK